MRAMLSAVNFEALDELGLSSIVGSRATKRPQIWNRISLER